MRSNKKIFPAVLFAMGLAGQLLLAEDLAAAPGNGEPSLLKRGGVDVVHRSGPFRLDVGVGAVGVDGFDTSRLVVTIKPRYELRQSLRSRLDVTFPFFWIPGSYPNPREVPCGEELGFLCGDLSPRPGDLQIGPSLALAPSLEWTFRTDCCFRPSLFLGAGVRRDRGRTVEVPAGSFTTDSATSALVTLGVAGERVLTRNLALRVEARAITTFYSETEITDFGGRVASLGGDTVTSAILTVGLQLGF